MLQVNLSSEFSISAPVPTAASPNTVDHLRSVASHPILPIQNQVRIKGIYSSFWSTFNTGRQIWSFKCSHSLSRKNLWRTIWAICQLCKVQLQFWSISIQRQIRLQLRWKVLSNEALLPINTLRSFRVPTDCKVGISHPERCVIQGQQYK